MPTPQRSHEQAQVEGARVDEQSFEDVGVPAQMRPPHAPGLVAMGVGSFEAVAALALQGSAPCAADASAIGVHLVSRRGLARPAPSAAMGFGNVRAQVQRRQIHQDLDPSCLSLEITEDAVIHNPRAAREQLAAFRALGISTAIDDFGTGQSSLSTLRELPVDGLKIDRSFIRDLDSSESARAITASITDIGHHLHLTVIAEGVETEEQLARLVAMGCDQAQGFLFSQGLPSDEFGQFVSEHVAQSPRARVC